MESPVPEMELPECPVCLQFYDDHTTIPRVLACGHSVCEICLTELPKPYPHTIRCPACTQLVNYPHPLGASALPKNIDLLRLIQNPNSKTIDNPKVRIRNFQLHPNLWSHEIYSDWKQWILPEDGVIIESGSEDEFSDLFYGRVLKENQKVSLFRVGLFQNRNDCKFVLSYVAKIMQVLHGMNESERGELDLILRASLKMGRSCKVYGLWYDKESEGVYIVRESYTFSYLKNGFMCTDKEQIYDGIKYKSSFAMIGTEVCEALMNLGSNGLVAGSLSLSWFDINEFGHVYIDLNKVLVMGRKVRRIISKSVPVKHKTDDKDLLLSLKDELLKAQIYISPELWFELECKEGIDLSFAGSNYEMNYGSDVWSLCSALLYILVGKSFIAEIDNLFDCLLVLASEENGFDFIKFYADWLEKVNDILKCELSSEFDSIKDLILKGLDLNPIMRPLIENIWKSIRELILNPDLDFMFNLDQKFEKEKMVHYLILGHLCEPEKKVESVVDANEVIESKMEGDIIKRISLNQIKSTDLKGHRDCITGLAVGGGFLFSSSFDKTVSVWSLEDYAHLHTFKCHEHRVMALVYSEEEQQSLCISGDNGGGICIWEIRVPFSEEPIHKLSEEKDWRYSGIHALAVSDKYFYTGNGDKTIKAWSMLDYTKSCTMEGHKSVVSTLAIYNGVLYSGSWDGTVRLWCISDHSPLAVLGEDTVKSVASVLSIAVDENTLVATHENGITKIWRNDTLLKSSPSQNGAVFSVCVEGKWIFTGGWSKIISVQELWSDESEMDNAISIGSIACDSVITSLLYRQGKLFVGQADKVIKVYYCGL